MGMTEEDKKQWDKPLDEKMDDLVKLVKESMGSSYWCKWCKRHLQPDPVTYKENGNLLFIHDDVYHPPNCVFDSGDEHIVH